MWKMIDVVCFCGNSYSFIGNAGACPHCGEVVTFARVSPSQTEASSGQRDAPATPSLDEQRPEDMAA
jgi:hypothetical protein